MTLETQGEWPSGGWAADDASRRGRGERDSAATSRGVVRLARGLGWFSVGLGLAQLLAPRRLAGLIGARDDRRKRNAMLALGARELTSGVGILSRSRPAGWLWGRLGGDLMDMALLRASRREHRANRVRLAVATAAVAGVAILDALVGRQLSRGGGARALRALPKRAVDVTRAITVNRSPREAYRLWRDFEGLPRFMAHLASVQVLDARRSHWTAKAPAGTRVEWDAEITEDQPDERIAWRAVERAVVPNSGAVTFVRAPGGIGTEVTVQLRYDAPGGALGKVIAKLFGEEPGQQIAGDLRRFKQVLETGEVVHSDASVHRGRHPAQPDPARRSEFEGGGR